MQLIQKEQRIFGEFSEKSGMPLCGVPRNLLYKVQFNASFMGADCVCFFKPTCGQPDTVFHTVIVQKQFGVCAGNRSREVAAYLAHPGFQEKVPVGGDGNGIFRQYEPDATKIHNCRIMPCLSEPEILCGYRFARPPIGIGTGDDAVAAVDVAVDHRQRFVDCFVSDTDSVLVGIRLIFTEKVQIPDPQAVFVCIEVDPVVPAAVPDGFLLRVVVGTVGGDGRGGGTG